MVVTLTAATVFSFACPTCRRVREISPRAARAIETGERTGTCRTGEGCRVAVDEAERRRRWWLYRAGVDPQSILRAGGACAYVLEHGLPAALVEIGWALQGSIVREPQASRAGDLAVTEGTKGTSRDKTRRHFSTLK